MDVSEVFLWASPYYLLLTSLMLAFGLSISE